MLLVSAISKMAEGIGKDDIGLKDGKLHLGSNVLVGKVTMMELFNDFWIGSVLQKEWLLVAKAQSFSDMVAIVQNKQVPTLIIFAVSILLGLLAAILLVRPASSKGKNKAHASSAGSTNAGSAPTKSGPAEEEDPPRDFTMEQLREFDGEGDKPIYVSLRGVVYDVSTARDFYGKGSCYQCFAGREASRAMAKLSFEESVIANTKLDDLNAMELDCLDNWIDKFKNYKCYPVRGKCSVPPEPRAFTRPELASFKAAADAPAPEGRIDAPIYLALNGKVLDVSYGGKENYGATGPYCILTGIDATRALAKMSFDSKDISSHDISDLTDKQRECLAQWDARLSKKYPVVGWLTD